MRKKKYIKVAKEVINLEIKALIKLRNSINDSFNEAVQQILKCCLLYTSPSPRDS